jgi:pimeloyl-ACP methyl ester carboxylesterase
LYDLRDHGESIGPLNSFNRMQVYQADLLEVVKYLKQRPKVKHIGVVGISLGAFATLNSSPDILNSFSALWMDGLRFENFGSRLPVKDPLDYLKYIFDQQTRWLAASYYKKSIPPPTALFTEIIPTIHNPKLMLVASGLDESERTTNEKLIPFLDNSNKQLWIIKNAWHIGGRFEVPDEYRERMLTFFAGAFND